MNMTDTIEIEILPFPDVVVLLTNMSPPPVESAGLSGQGERESVEWAS